MKTISYLVGCSGRPIEFFQHLKEAKVQKTTKIAVDDTLGDMSALELLKWACQDLRECPFDYQTEASHELLTDMLLSIACCYMRKKSGKSIFLVPFLQ